MGIAKEIGTSSYTGIVVLLRGNVSKTGKKSYRKPKGVSRIS